MAENNAYWTPPYVTAALLRHDWFPSPIWEPCCGSGSIAKVLKQNHRVACSDIVDRGFRKTNIHNFLDHEWGTYRARYRSIVTNPPYKDILKWVRQALLYQRPKPEKVAMLLPISALADFAYVLPQSQFCLTKILLFKKRITFTGPDEGGTNWGVCWFVCTLGQGLKGEILSIDDYDQHPALND